jgi:radical SAM protein with 4Fe4S-binding SPASM domain
MLIDSDGEVYPCPNHRHPEFRCGKISENPFQDIWVRSPLLTELRAIYDLEDNNEECGQCPIKHWCMGGCRGETYENTQNLRGPSIRCQENRSVIIEMMWLLASEGEITQDSDRTEYF